jgi:FkbH-like protein
MVLKLEDFACFVANWDDKAANLRAIAQQLDIGLDSLVFVDDSPVERALVRSLVPDVAVPELPDDPAGWIRVLDQHRYFQVVSIQTEDFRRADYYRANVARQQVEAATSSIEEFLRSLEMKARIEPIGPGTLERAAQLVARSNQFNLTTRRHTSAQILAMTEDDAWVTQAVSLTDRFGDTGLISVLLAKVDGTVLDIDTWLMSCRVLKRGVEAFLMNHLYNLALERGVGTIRGTYIPTAKNALVRDHYALLGFAQLDAAEDGVTRWELAVTDDWKPVETFIEQESVDG